MIVNLRWEMQQKNNIKEEESNINTQHEWYKRSKIGRGCHKRKCRIHLSKQYENGAIGVPKVVLGCRENMDLKN